MNQYYLNLYHSGVGHDEDPPGRGSGRYPYGSGKRPHQDKEPSRLLKGLGTVGKALGKALLTIVGTYVNADFLNFVYREEPWIGLTYHGYQRTKRQIENITGRIRVNSEAGKRGLEEVNKALDTTSSNKESDKK